MVRFTPVPLREVMRESQELIHILPTEVYRQVTVRLWGKGVVLRAEVNGSEIASSVQRVVRRDQFLLSRIDARNGALGLVPPQLDGAVTSNDFPSFTVDRSRLIPSYLGWMSKTADFVDKCRAASEGTTNRVRLQVDRFLGQTVPLPPLAEQQRIVARVEELAGKIERARGLRGWTQEAMEDALTGAYRRIIIGADSYPMKEVAPLIRRPITVHPTEPYLELGVRSFGKGTFHKPPVSGIEIGNKRIFTIEPGDLLFNIVFAWEGSVAVAQPEDIDRVGSHRFLTCVPDPGIALPSFLWFHFLTEAGLEQLGRASPGGAGRNRTLGLDALAKISVPVPSLEKQRWFDTLLVKVAQLKRMQSESDTKLHALLPSVLAKAFAGEL